MSYCRWSSDFFERLQELKDDGLHVPEYAIEALIEDSNHE